MREIKFRAWNGKKMINYNNWFTLHDQSVLCFEEKTEHSYVDESDVDSPNRVSLMQYTGLKDKSGKEIYEGDLLRYPADEDWERVNYTAFEVFWHGNDATPDGVIGWKIERCHYHGSICGGYIPRFLPKETHKMEVIGNIYENPELLKKEV